MNAIRAIETHYKGYRFRSRLEARWAVFFDALDLKWEYEPEGFVTAAGPYLPDFRVWTPQGEPMWYEVKPEHVTSEPEFEAFRDSLFADFLSVPADERSGLSPVRASLLNGDPASMFTTDKSMVCPRCGQAKRREYVRSYTARMSHGGLHAGEHLSLGYCAPCFLETRPLERNHETINPYLMDILEPFGTGVLRLPYRATNGWILGHRDFGYQVETAAYTARGARFEHGERGRAT